MMTIRSFQAGDELTQIEIYNRAAASLPKFKPATLAEVQRRTKASGFDPSTRLYGEIQGKVVGYATFTNDGRASFPWMLPGHEHLREPLFQALIAAVTKAGLRKIYAAYREDWAVVNDFFLKHGFHKARDMVNFAIDLIDMPTPAAMPSTSFTSLEPEDVPALLKLAPEILHTQQVEVLTRHFFKNPYFSPDSLYTLRARGGKEPVAVGILVADPSVRRSEAGRCVDALLSPGSLRRRKANAKRIKGLFSFLAQQDRNLNHLAMDLLGQASYRLRDADDIDTLAAQAPSDAPGLLSFYSRNFRRQGSFPILRTCRQRVMND